MSINKLIIDHAPILWIHPNEAFIPEDCGIMVEVADLYKDGEKVDSFNNTLSNLRRYGKDYYLKIRDIDMREFTVPKGSGVAGIGPDAVAEYARRKYGNNPFSKFTTRVIKPKFYARVDKVILESSLPSTTLNIPEIQRMKNYLGKYTVLQYFYFYIFNDFWNKHVGDWDSTIEVIIKEKSGEKFLLYSTHETTWFMNFNEVDPDLNKWIKVWKKNKDGKKGPNNVYSIKSHPFGFVSNGGHGVYPTPGYTFYGQKLPGMDDIIGATDERVIGHTCIAPKDVSEADIKNVLRNSKPAIDDSNVKFLNWDFEILKNQSWLKYGGLWGEKAEDMRGWDGPQGPTIRDKWEISPDNIYKKINLALQERYTEWFIIKNHHEIV